MIDFFKENRQTIIFIIVVIVLIYLIYPLLSGVKKTIERSVGSPDTLPDRIDKDKKPDNYDFENCKNIYEAGAHKFWQRPREWYSNSAVIVTIIKSYYNSKDRFSRLALAWAKNYPNEPRLRDWLEDQLTDEEVSEIRSYF